MTVKSLAPAGDDVKSCRILVAIDFGTTFSGIAWAQSARPDIQDCIIQWPDANGSLQGKTQEKVPTEMSYDSNGQPRWGFQIPEGEPRHQWFKLALDPSMTDQVSHLTVEYPDPKALPLSYERDEVKLVADYLGCLHKHTQDVLKLKLGKGVVNSTPIEYTLTVPAIFEDEAQARFKAVAAKAGMGDADTIRVVSEPEAAAVFTLDAMDPHNLKKGDKFVLCDAGGGTVDLITYQITEMRPKVIIKEAVPGDGEPCGGTFLNRIFGKYLADKFEDDDEWDDDIQEDAMHSFELAKREFTGDKPLVVSVNGLPDDAGRGIKRGRLTIPAAVIKSKLEPIISLIVALIKKQLKQAKNAKAVLMVGGFGGSVYLRKCVERVVGPKIEVIQPPNGWTAIEKGALIWALNESSPEDARINIASRKARKHYGLRCGRDFDPSNHDENLRYWSAFERELAGWSDGLGREEGSQKLAVLNADLSAISTGLIPIETGKDGLNYFVLRYEIHVRFFSAHTEYSLWYKGKEYGKVDAEYA